MSRVAWRIATDTPDYEADDLSGIGAEKTGGRWNKAGAKLVYAAESRALACLETIVHLNSGALPFNRYLVEVEIPDEVWSRAQRETSTSLPIGWDSEPAGKASIDFGVTWLHAMTSALLVVPSVIVPEEFNVLINPQHPDRAALTARKVRRWLYDPRMLAGPPGRRSSR